MHDFKGGIHSRGQDPNTISEIRTLPVYDNMCQRLTKDPTLTRDLGINETTLLRTLPYFDIFNQCPFDMMHTINEGIKKLAMEKVISLNNFVNQVNAFPYGPYFSLDKPSMLTVAHFTDGLRQTSTQMYRLAFVMNISVLI